MERYLLRKHFANGDPVDEVLSDPPSPTLIQRVADPVFLRAFYPSNVRRVELVRVVEEVIVASDR